MVFKTNYHLMQVRSIAECILQYFRPSLSYHLSYRSLFCLFLSGHFTQVLLYMISKKVYHVFSFDCSESSSADCWRHYRSLHTTKPVFRVSDKERLKPVSSATETSYKILSVASLDMILSKKRITKTLIRLHGWAGCWSVHLLFTNP